MKYSITSLILALLLIGCSNGQNTPSTESKTDILSGSETQTKPEQETDGLPEKDMEGFELRFYNYDDSWFVWAENRLDAAKTTSGDIVNDRIYERNRSLEERFNCKISEISVANTDTNLKKLITAGDDFCDIAMMYDCLIASYQTGDYLRSWNDLPYVQFDKPWWDSDANKVFRIGGNQFGAVGDFSLSMHSRNYLYVFNKSMYSEVGDSEDIYRSVSDGTWTVDRMFEEGRKVMTDLDGNGIMNENDRYGITAGASLEYQALISGAGIRYIDTKNGELIFALPGNTYAADVMQDLFDIHSDNVYVSFTKNVDTTDFDFFINGHSLFLGTSMKYIEKFRDMDYDIGYLPVPKYSEEQDEYHCLSAGGAIALLPQTTEESRFENIGMLLEAMSWSSNRELVPAYVEQTLKSKYTRDEESVKMLQIILSSSFYDIGVSVMDKDTQYVIINQVFYPKKDVIASTIASMEKKVNSALEELMK